MTNRCPSCGVELEPEGVPEEHLSGVRFDPWPRPGRPEPLRRSVPEDVTGAIGWQVLRGLGVILAIEALIFGAGLASLAAMHGC